MWPNLKNWGFAEGAVKWRSSRRTGAAKAARSAAGAMTKKNTNTPAMTELTPEQRRALRLLASGRGTVTDVAVEGITIQMLKQPRERLQPRLLVPSISDQTKIYRAVP
jgi:hypothetical protein